MKEFFKAMLILIGSTIVSICILWFLFLYQLGYSIWLSVTLKKWNAFFLFWWKNIDGIMASVGHAMYHIGYAQDMLWNVNGEALEDMITSKEKTSFGEKNTTVSASVGELEINGDLNKYGKFSSRALNFVFRQKQHALDAFYMKLERERLDKKYFN